VLGCVSPAKRACLDCSYQLPSGRLLGNNGSSPGNPGVRRASRTARGRIPSFMRNIAIVLLVIAVAVLGLYAYHQRDAPRQQQGQLQKLNEKLHATTNIASIEPQERCAKQAQEFLSQFITFDLVETRAHFNEGFNKCFVETRTVRFDSGNRSESGVLQDAVEGRDYGSYIFISERNKADLAVPPVVCKVMLPSGERKTCHSLEEFDALVKQYME